MRTWLFSSLDPLLAPEISRVCGHSVVGSKFQRPLDHLCSFEEPPGSSKVSPMFGFFPTSFSATVTFFFSHTHPKFQEIRMTHIYDHILCFPAPRPLLKLLLLPRGFFFTLEARPQIPLVFEKPHLNAHPVPIRGTQIGSLKPL